MNSLAEENEPRPATGPLQTGAELAGYVVQSLIGRGGMAYVYRAVDRRLGRTVALKVLPPELAQSQDFRRRFLRESRLAASVDHPNLIPIYDAGEAAGLLYIAMRFVEGSDLKTYLRAERQLDTARTIAILSQVAAALDAAHACGLVHRDVKPANILISRGTSREGSDHVYLSDFGLSKRSSSDSDATAAGAVIGTMDYIAPEQIAGKPLDGRTDVYALGCMVYELLTGAVPFIRNEEAAMLWAHLVEMPAPISDSRSDLQPSVDTVVTRAMAKAPEDRYPTCGEFIAALAAELNMSDRMTERAPSDQLSSQAPPADDEARRPSPSAPERPAQPVPPAARKERGRKRLGVLVGAGIVAVALIIALLVMQQSRTSSSRFTANSLVPFSFDYPSSWQKAGPGTNVVFSPQAEAILPLFDQPGATQNWSAVRRLLSRDPNAVVGMYTFFNRIRYGQSADDVRQVLLVLLPAKVTITRTDSEHTMDGHPAVRLDGELSDPTVSTSRLRFECYVVQLQTPEPQTVHILFFSPPGSFDRQHGDFDRIRQSVLFSWG